MHCVCFILLLLRVSFFLLEKDSQYFFAIITHITFIKHKTDLTFVLKLFEMTTISSRSYFNFSKLSNMFTTQLQMTIKFSTYLQSICGELQ